MRAFALSLVSLIYLAACGDNLDPVAPWILDTVEPADGFWIRTPEFPVASSTELQDCYFFQVPDIANGADLWIDHTTLALNPVRQPQPTSVGWRRHIVWLRAVRRMTTPGRILRQTRKRDHGGDSTSTMA